MASKVAALQLCTQSDFTANLVELEALIREAAGHGAQFIATPENSDLMGVSKEEKLARVYYQEEHPFLPRCCALAKELGVWISLGSLGIRLNDSKFYNRSFLISPQGEILAQYDKIHLFDVTLPGGEVHQESLNIQGGDCLVTASTDLGKMGLSICYDVRFPQLFRQMAQGGCEILLVPAAFTVLTGQLHWDVLLRARAIENGAFVIAAAQGGEHGAGRVTYGHSMIVDPWGKILAEAKDGQSIIYADLDLDEVSHARQAIASLRHDRDFS